MSYLVGTQSVVTFSGSNGAAEYVSFWQSCGRPAELAKNKEFLWQGFLVRFMPSL